MRHEVCLALLALVACTAPEPLSLGPSQERPSASARASSSAVVPAPSRPEQPAPRLEALAPDPQRPGHHLARLDGEPVVLVLATRDDPQRVRPPVALAALSGALGLRVVPRTELREFTLAALLDASAPALVDELARSLAVEAHGRVKAAVTFAPPRTRRLAARWSHEEQRWSRLAESTAPLTPAERAEADDWIAILTLDYLSANLLRRTVEQDDEGRLWLVDNLGAFREHPEQLAVDQILARLKRTHAGGSERWQRVAQLDDERLAAWLAAGDYEQWLVHRRARREVAIRARALSSWGLASAP